MNALKEKLLNDTYEKFMEVGLISDYLPLNILDQILVEDVMGFGTTLDEKIFSISGLQELINRQREQSKGLQMQWSISPVKHHIAVDGNSAVFADDVSIAFTVNNETIKMDLRFSVVFEFRKDRWFVVHWHGSKPENIESETDTFGIEE